MYRYIAPYLIFIITAVFGCAVGHRIRKGGDFVIHGREVWIGVLMCNSYKMVVVKKQFFSAVIFNFPLLVA